MDSIYLTLFHIFRFFIKFTPKFIMNPSLNALASLIYSVNKKHRKIAKVNLDLAYEDRISEDRKASIIKGCYKNLVYTLADFIKNQGASKEEILNKISFENEHIIQKAIDENRTIEETLALQWKAVSNLPKNELTKVHSPMLIIGSYNIKKYVPFS